MIIPLSVKNQSIESSGITNDYKDAICEYVWNGLEAHATNIDIEYDHNVAWGVDELIIRDNGDGINYNDLEETFGAFMASQKNLLSLKMKSKANKGKGRFSFIAFAKSAEWETVYKDTNGLLKYIINLSDEKKEVVECTEPDLAAVAQTGTSVVFRGIENLTVENMGFDILEPALLREFSWYLYLFKNKDIKVNINNTPIDYTKYINTKLSEKKDIIIDGNQFEINLIVWQESIKEKYCCYFFDSSDSLKNRSTTTFNRNTIAFNHSVFVKSSFFDSKEDLSPSVENQQISLFESLDDKKTLKKLHTAIQKLIEKKISIYLSEKADKAVRDMMEVKKTFPKFSNDIYGQMRKKDLAKVTKEIYQLEPRVFYNLKFIQEKSLLGFLNLLLSSEERENVLVIIEQIVDLTAEQRKDFSQILKKTSLENIIETIKFIEDRYKIIELLKTIVYEIAKFSNERNHIQKIIENHFWLFGENYHLASADQRMKNALEQYTNILYGVDDINASLEPDVEKERRMDIFLCNTRNVETEFQTTLEENIIVELKAPKVPLSKKVLRQVEDYMDFVRKQPNFNSVHRRWKFIAVCKEVDDDVKSRYEALKGQGKVGLVCQVENYEVYALTWDDVFKSFELKHTPLLERLNYDREKVASELMDEVKTAEGRQKADELTQIAITTSV